MVWTQMAVLADLSVAVQVTVVTPTGYGSASPFPSPRVPATMTPSPVPVAVPIPTVAVVWPAPAVTPAFDGQVIVGPVLPVVPMPLSDTRIGGTATVQAIPGASVRAQSVLGIKSCGSAPVLWTLLIRTGPGVKFWIWT